MRAAVKEHGVGRDRVGPAVSERCVAEGPGSAGLEVHHREAARAAHHGAAVPNQGSGTGHGCRVPRLNRDPARFVGTTDSQFLSAMDVFPNLVVSVLCDLLNVEGHLLGESGNHFRDLDAIGALLLVQGQGNGMGEAAFGEALYGRCAGLVDPLHLLREVF